MSKLTCGAAKRRVTPALGLNIPQCMTLNPATGVKDELYTHAIALECDGKTVILISVDVSGLGTAFSRRVRAEIAREIGIEPSAVMVSAIHLHTAGPQLMEVFWGQKEDKAVTAFFLRETVAAAVEAYRTRVPVRMQYAEGREDRFSFCRNYRMTDGTVRTNPGRKRAHEIVSPVAEIDYTLSAVRFLDGEGKTVAEIVNFACHPDTVGGHEYCADYPGELRRALNERYGEHTALFLNGCSGNVNHVDARRYVDPDFRYPKDHYKVMGRALAEDVIALYEGAVRDAENAPIAFALRRFRALRRQPTDAEILKARAAISDPATGKVDRRLAEELLRLHERPKRYELVEMQVLRIGELYVVGFPGEPFADMGLRLRDRAAPHTLLLSELANNELGYFATEPAFSGGVYEAVLPSAPFTPDVLDRMIDTAAELVEKIGAL